MASRLAQFRGLFDEAMKELVPELYDYYVELPEMMKLVILPHVVEVCERDEVMQKLQKRDIDSLIQIIYSLPESAKLDISESEMRKRIEQLPEECFNHILLNALKMCVIARSMKS